jgi:uncharacterized membrane protein YraQ (UPF0718 family)
MSVVSRLLEHRGELIVGLILIAGYLVAANLPAGIASSYGPAEESLALLREYAREHVLTCLIPALAIAGAIASLLSKGAVVRTFGADAPVILSFSVAAVSGSILAVCSCTVLPLFAGIYRRGAGIGPATAFLYSGPAINVLAIVLTARVLGAELGIARGVGAVLLALVVGALMAITFRVKKGEGISGEELAQGLDAEETSLGKSAAVIGLMVVGLILLTWQPAEDGVWKAIYETKWPLAAAAWLGVAVLARLWFGREQLANWWLESWKLTKQIMPLLAAGVLVAGFLLGRPEGAGGLIPNDWIAGLVGGNSILANLTASVVGALMYFATLTEVPILQGLIGSGMGNGPALALLLAGPALSLPNMLVINSVIGPRKTLAFVVYIVVFSTAAGLLYGLAA